MLRISVTLACLSSNVPSLLDSPFAEAGINLSEPHSSDLTSDIFGVRSSALQAAKWWRALGAHHLLPLPAPSSLQLCGTTGPGHCSVNRCSPSPLFALLMALTLQCHSWVHVEHWTAITCLFKVNELSHFLRMDLSFFLFFQHNAVLFRSQSHSLYTRENIEPQCKYNNYIFSNGDRIDFVYEWAKILRFCGLKTQVEHEDYAARRWCTS